MRTTKEPDALDRAAIGAQWQDALLELFWTVDATVKANNVLDGIAVEIFEAYEHAEKLRRRL